MVIQTKQVFKYVLHWNIIIVFFTFWWIRAMCLHQVEKNVTGPWISWNFVYIFLQYMESLYVEMVSWQRPQSVKKLIPNLTEYKIYGWKLGYHLIKNDCPPAILIHTKPFIISTNLSMIKLFNKAFLRPLHDMSITLEMIITGYPKVL